MNYTSDNTPNLSINFLEVIWDLLAQWKMVLVFAFLTAVLLSGLKYTRDIKAYQDNIESKKREEEIAAMPMDQRIEKALEPLSAEEQVNVMYIVSQQLLVRNEEQYLSESLLLNASPTSQRVLELSYYIKGNGETDAQAVCDAYRIAFNSDRIIGKLGEVIDPQVELKYVAELLNIPNGVFAGDRTPGSLLAIKMILPDGVDETAVEAVFDQTMTAYEEPFRQAIGDFTVSAVNREISNIYNTTAMDKKVSVTYAITNIQNSVRNNRAIISKEQLTALNTITDIMNSVEAGEDGADQALNHQEDTTVLENETASVSFSKRIMVLGFFAGIFIYAFVFLIDVIRRNTLMAAANTEVFTQSRLLGDIYYEAGKGLLGFLMHSGLINKLRYRDKNDQQLQSDRTVNKLEAVCEHANTRKISLLKVIDHDEKADRVIDRIIRTVNKDGIEAEVIKVTGEVNENELLHISNAVSVVGKNSGINDLMSLLALCQTYEIKQLGSIYIGGK